MDPPSGRRPRTPRCCGPRTAVFTACCRASRRQTARTAGAHGKVPRGGIRRASAGKMPAARCADPYRLLVDTGRTRLHVVGGLPCKPSGSPGADPPTVRPEITPTWYEASAHGATLGAPGPLGAAADNSTVKTTSAPTTASPLQHLPASTPSATSRQTPTGPRPARSRDGSESAGTRGADFQSAAVSPSCTRQGVGMPRPHTGRSACGFQIRDMGVQLCATSATGPATSDRTPGSTSLSRPQPRRVGATRSAIAAPTRP